MHRIPLPLFITALCAVLLAWPLHFADARGARGGSFGGKSSSSGSSFSSSRSSRPAVSTSSSSSRPSWGSSSSSRQSSSTSRADSTLSTRVNRGGTDQSRGDVFDSRQSTSSNSGRGSDTSPSSGSGRSTTSSSRGSTSVPQSMQLPSGQHAPVYRDDSRGGTGFFDGVGKWILLSSVMNNSGFGGNRPYYGGNNGYQAPQTGVASSSSSGGGGGGWIVVLGALVLIVLVIAGIAVFRSSMAPRPGQVGGQAITALGEDTGANAKPRTALEEWTRLQPGTFVTLSDAQAIADSQKRGGGVRGIDYTVETVGVAKDVEGFATWVFATLYDGHQRLMLMIKGDESAMEHRVYFPMEDFRPARREALLARGDHWLFEEPENSQNASPDRLRFAAEIPYAVDGAQAVYVRKDHGERHADYTETPAPGGLGEMLATIAEYSTSDPAENPELLVLEIASLKARTGEVTLYLGAPLRNSEVELVKAASV